MVTLATEVCGRQADFFFKRVTESGHAAAVAGLCHFGDTPRGLLQIGLGSLHAFLRRCRAGGGNPWALKRLRNCRSDRRTSRATLSTDILRKFLVG